MASVPSPPVQSAFNGCVARDDILEVMCKDSEGNISFDVAVVWSVLDDGFEVYYLNRSVEDQLKWVFEDHFQFIPWQAVNQHWPLSDYKGSVAVRRKRAFKACGYRDVGDGFYKISEETVINCVAPSRKQDIGVEDSDSDESCVDSDEDCELEDLDEDGNLRDLVAPESEVECFTEATTPFGMSVNYDQTAFDEAEPTNNVQMSVKDAVQKIELRVRREEANKRWSRRK